MLISACMLSTSCECICHLPAAQRQACIDSLAILFSQAPSYLAIALSSCVVPLLGPALADPLASETSRSAMGRLRTLVLTTRNCHYSNPAICQQPHAFGHMIQRQAASLSFLKINFLHGSSIEDTFWMSGAELPRLPNLVIMRGVFGLEFVNYGAPTTGVQTTLDVQNFARALFAASPNLDLFSLRGELLHMDLIGLFKACSNLALRELHLEHGRSPSESEHVATSLPALMNAFPSVVRVEGRQGPIFVRHT